MIGGVPDSNEAHDEARAETPTESGASSTSSPLILIPITAEDFAWRRRRVVLACIAAAVLGALAIYWAYRRAVDPLQARESYDAGARLLEATRYSQAILSFDRAIALKPDLVDAYWQRGRAYVALREQDLAIRDFTQVIRFRVSDPLPLIDRASAYLDLHNYDATLADCAKALRLDPKVAAAYYLHGMSRRAQNDPRGALDDFNRAVELDPSAANYFQRGSTYQVLGDHQQAIADLTKVIAYKPDSSQAYFARAESLRALGDLKAANRDHSQGRQLDSR
jgi:tetratricopeptide (TPR) repeat protein